MPGDHDENALLAVLLVLTFLSGVVDAVCYLGLGRVFTANMTGNIVILGFAAAGAPGFSVTASLTSLVVFLAGVTVIGSQTGLNGACGKLYPARMRTSGYGLATGIGRLGGIAAAPLGGFLLARGLPPTYVFLSACFFALIAAMATAFLALPGRRTSSIAVLEMAS